MSTAKFKQLHNICLFLFNNYCKIKLSKGLNDLEPRLIRHGYNTKVIAGLLNVRPGVIRSFIHS